MADGAQGKTFKINKLGYNILGVIARVPQSGYDVVKALSKFRPVNISQVYPIVAEMEEQGLLSSDEVVQTGKPNKKVYHLLEPGRRALQDWIAAPSDPPEQRDDFVNKVYSFWLSPAGDRASLVRDRLQHIHEEVAYFSAKLEALHEEFGGVPDDPDTWQFSRQVLMTRRLILYRNEIDWCNALLQKMGETK